MLDLVKVIQEESYTYRDPITSFIEDLYVKFDFDSAQQKLRECEAVLSTDFFLVACLQVRTLLKGYDITNYINVKHSCQEFSLFQI